MALLGFFSDRSNSPRFDISKNTNFSPQFCQVKKTSTWPLTIAETGTLGFSRVVFRGDGEMDPLVLAKASEHLEVFLLVLCRFYFFPPCSFITMDAMLGEQGVSVAKLASC